MWKQFHKIYTLLAQDDDDDGGTGAGGDGYDSAWNSRTHTRVCCYTHISPVLMCQTGNHCTQLEIYPKEKRKSKRKSKSLWWIETIAMTGHTIRRIT